MYVYNKNNKKNKINKLDDIDLLNKIPFKDTITTVVDEEAKNYVTEIYTKNNVDGSSDQLFYKVSEI
jgi:hypothetical protein